MSPAQQRLEADRLAGRHRDLRLKFEVEIAALQRLRQILVDAALQGEFALHLRIEHPRAAPSVVLRPIKRHVGPGEQFLDIDFAIRSIAMPIEQLIDSA